MARFTALLKGINVGRNKRVPMAELRVMLTALGYTEVHTLLNSGNVVFDSPLRSTQKLAQQIETIIATTLHIDVPVVVKSAETVMQIMADNPLASAASDPSRLLVVLTADSATLTSLAPIAARLSEHERWHIGYHAAYLWCPQGLLDSAAANALLGKAGKGVTTRNWATMGKLAALLS